MPLKITDSRAAAPIRLMFGGAFSGIEKEASSCRSCLPPRRNSLSRDISVQDLIRRGRLIEEFMLHWPLRSPTSYEAVPWSLPRESLTEI